MSASGRSCGAAPDDAAAPAGHAPLPACELNSLLPERPAAAAEGWWPALRGALPPPDGPPASGTGSGCKTGLFAGCCCPGAAPCAVCVPHVAPGGTGCAAAPPAFAAPAAAAAAARCPLLWQKAAVRLWRRHASHLTAAWPGGRPRPGIPHANQRNSCANAFGRQGFVFASLRRIASAKETHNLASQTMFRQHARW
jgi:hypothetical protein